MTEYGHTLKIGGSTYGASGYSSRLEARKSTYGRAIRDGYREGPLREKWWQFWRPTEYSEGYLEALAETSPIKRKANDDC